MNEFLFVNNVFKWLQKSQIFKKKTAIKVIWPEDVCKRLIYIRRISIATLWIWLSDIILKHDL